MEQDDGLEEGVREEFRRCGCEPPEGVVELVAGTLREGHQPVDMADDGTDPLERLQTAFATEEGWAVMRRAVREVIVGLRGRELRKREQVVRGQDGGSGDPFDALRRGFVAERGLPRRRRG